MARRRSSKGLSDYLRFWSAPMIMVLLAPLYLHGVATDSAEFTDAHMLAVLLLFLIISSLSVLGCVLDAVFLCPSSFPVLLVVVQMALIVAGILLRYSQLDIELLPRFVAKKPGPLLSETASVPNQSKPVAGPDVGSDADPLQRLEAASVDSVQQPKVKDLAQGFLEKPPELLGWSDAGDGYCQDGETHQELSALHARGKTIQECAEAANSDQSSIAFDFSKADGGCDIRYKAGVLAVDIEGYEWYGWGEGSGIPVGSGKQKHDLATHCYVKSAPVAPVVQTAAQLHEESAHSLTATLHPYYKALIREYSFNAVKTERGASVNIILVHSPFQNQHEEDLFEKYKHEILFIGISSLEDFPLPPPNPFSPKFPADRYVGLFPGFLNMYRVPEKIYPSHVKVLDMSQSDFSLPDMQTPFPKKYDFTFSGTDQDVASDCVGWSSFAKNWSFVLQALEVMCGELAMTGVLVATKDKQDKKACSIPKSCDGLITQTTYLDQDKFFSYVRQSHFQLMPQVHDASPRVATQALALNVPLLMNSHLIGGWKYLNEKTGEFFSDISDFRESAQRILRNAKAGGVYEPRKWVTEHYGDAISGARLKKFIEDNFKDRVALPRGTKLLFPQS